MSLHPDILMFVSPGCAFSYGGLNGGTDLYSNLEVESIEECLKICQHFDNCVQGFAQYIYDDHVLYCHLKSTHGSDDHGIHDAMVVRKDCGEK